MRFRVILLSFLLLGMAFSNSSLLAQNFPGLTYQAVARDASGLLIKNQAVNLTVEIFQGDPNAGGVPVYEATFPNTPTNEFGLINLVIGEDDAAFGQIQWENGPHYATIDLNGVEVDLMRFSTIPYSERSKKATEMTLADLMDVEGIPMMGDQLVWDGNEWTPSAPVADPDADPTNELQDLSLNGDSLSISGGNTVALPTQPPYIGGTGIAVTGQIIINTQPDQVVSLTGNGATTVGGTYPAFTITSADSVNDADADPANEIQTLSQSGNTITLSNGGGSFVDQVNDADASSTNELQNLSLSGSLLSLTNGGSVSLANFLSPWVSSGSNLYRSIGSVGIGTTSPTHRLHLAGTNQTLRLTGTFGGGLGYGGKVNFGDGNFVYIDEPSDDNMRIHASTVDLDGTVTTNGFVVGNNLWLLSSAAGGGGFFETDGPNGNQNFVLSSLSGNNNHGFAAVRDAGGTSQAGMYVDGGGQGIVFGDVKSFRMEHPQQASKEIWYASLEGPEAGAYERGTGQLVNGEAFIPFTDHFSVVVNPATLTVSLTPLDANSEGMAVIEKTSQGFRVKELHQGTGNYAFDWEVKGVRMGYEDFKVVREATMLENAPEAPVSLTTDKSTTDE
ncbi:MAG: hypothetical protein AAF399_26535 [Bacteroidota bacterium]